MRSKFAIWSDEGILSKPKATGFARVRGIIVVCSVCGIAAASVYSQIGADRGAPATDRATGYGAEGRPAQAQRAQSPAPLSNSGTTTGVASVAGAAPKSTGKVTPSPAAEPTSIAATPDSTAQPARPRASSELTRTSSDSTARSESRSYGGDAATATAETNADTDNKASRSPSNPDEKRRGTKRSARSGSTRSWVRDDGYAGFESRDGRDRSGFVAFGPPDGRGRGYSEFDPRDRRNSFAQFEPSDRRVRNDESRGGRRYPSQSSPFNWFGIPFQ